MKRSHFASLLLGLVLFLAQSLVAATYYVGSCENAAFSSIQGAINAVAPGSIIDVCPGTYAEQITIPKSLTLRGTDRNGSSQVVIAVPSNGLATVPTLNFDQAAPQINVTAGPVNISNITVDGTASANCPTGNYIGIFYNSGSSGRVNEVETRNQNCAASAGGVGIAAQNVAGAVQSVTVENSNVNNNSFAGIFACSFQTPTTLNALIENNYVAGSDNGIIAYCNVGGSVSDNVVLVGPNGVGLIANSPYSTVKGNTVIGGTAGIYLIGDANVTVSDNTVVGATSYGIAVGTPGTVRSNQITNIGQDAIYVYADGATVRSNIIFQSNVGIEFNCHTGTVTGNTINGTAAGFDEFPGTSTDGNLFQNVTTDTTGCS